MYRRHGEEGKEDSADAEEQGEEKKEVEEEPEEGKREGEERRREGGIRGNRMDRGKVPIVLLSKEWEEEEEEVGFGAKEQSMQEHFPFLRVPNGDGPPHNFP